MTTSEQMHALWKSVQANHATLESCDLHEFSIDATPEKQLGKRWRCARCGGEVGAVDKLWYDRGRRDRLVRAREGVERLEKKLRVIASEAGPFEHEARQAYANAANMLAALLTDGEG